jgi:hypothetical protein
MVHDPRLLIDSTSFEETILWVSGQFLASTHFWYQQRSPQIEPRRAIGENIPNAERQHLVAEVVLKRARLLTRRANSEDPLPEQMGRLLACYRDENVLDGASESASKGFFDSLDTPPWDLWVSYEGGELISWVPEVWIGLTQRGIDANPVNCIQWAGSAFNLKPLR